MNVPIQHRGRAFLALLAYLVFVVYGSLVPFEPRPVSLENAIATFKAIPYLDLDAEARADWVANILLYIPLAFLGCNWLVGMRSTSPLRHLSALLILAFCLAVAVGVEFTQIFFAPRTVSLNDLWAESLGSALGLALFALGRGRIARLQDSFRQGGHESVVAATVVLGLIYLALSLFPYDFIVSRDEWSKKIASGSVGWLIAGDCEGVIRCVAREIGELGAIAPLGLLWALSGRSNNARRLFYFGAALGLLLEILQLIIVSGVSQGISVLTRGAGLAAGGMIGRFLRQRGPSPLARIVRFSAIPLALPYLVAVAAVGGFFSSTWLPWDEAIARIADLRLMPFYYHYWSTETEATVSLLSNAGMYSPIGIAWWGFCFSKFKFKNQGVLWAGMSAALLAALVELGRLFLKEKHPDMTNLLIAGFSAAMLFTMAKWIASVLASGDSTGASTSFRAASLGEEANIPETPSPKLAARAASFSPIGLVVALALALSTLAGIVQYPLGNLWLCLAMLGYAALLWGDPWRFLFVVPALLPTLDLSPLTGRLLLDEFDLIVLASLAVLYLKLSGTPPLPWNKSWLAAAFILLWSSWAASFARGLWPLFSLASGAAESSHTPLEAWYVGKGMLWALLFVPILRRAPQENLPLLQLRFLGGILAGLLAVGMFVLWERKVFVGLWDFQNDFRVTGTFADMNTGGAYIETFLAFAFPVLVAAVLGAHSWTVRLVGVAAAGIVSYAMMVTFSRGGYAGLLAGVLPLLLAMRFRKGLSTRQWVFLGGVLAASAAAAYPVLTGEFAKARLSNAAQDLSVRRDHWLRALNLMDGGPLTALVGMGFGRYPTIYALQGENVRAPGSYTVLRGGENAFLRLGSGESVYLDQLVNLESGKVYKLSAKIRQPFGDASLSAHLCRKSLLYSFECVGKTLEPDRSGHHWREITVDINGQIFDSEADWPYRAVKLSLGNPGNRGLIDLDDISLKTADGRELLRNGDFSRGARNWLFVADQDLAWHIHQQEVEMYFAQGLLGLFDIAALLVAAGKALWPALIEGEFGAAALAGALLGFLTVGLLGSTMDTARLSMLFYLGAFCAALLTKSNRRASSN